MNHTELLNQLIAAVYALPLGANSKEIHDLQMFAAEIKGRMLASEPTPQPADDGWIENTGAAPKTLSMVKLRNGDIHEGNNPLDFDFELSARKNNSYDITHYKPA